jgi:signal peptidase
MAKDEPAPREGGTRDAAQEGWKAWARDIAFALVIMAVILGAMYVYTGVWPPLVVVESSSMQHSDTESYLGVIDTGDLVFVQAAPARTDVVTYVQGRATGYSTYGDYGDVIVFRLFTRPQDTPIIHRAIMYVIPNGTCGPACADVPDLALLSPADWGGVTRGGQPTHVPYGLESLWIRDMGYRHLNVTFDFSRLSVFFSRGPGYLTMGDHNAPVFDTTWFPIQSDIIGHARGEFPWFGLIKLLVSPAATCCQGWGDPRAPGNSWTNLALSLAFLVALPFILEAAGWAWEKYAWPKIRPLLRRPEPKRPEAPPPERGDADDREGPKEGSSGP